MWTIVGRVLSLVIAIGYVAAAIVSEVIDKHRVSPAILGFIAFLLVPLAMIWFPEEIGSFTGYAGRGGYVDTESPPILISVLGWFFLVGMPILLCVLWS